MKTAPIDVRRGEGVAMARIFITYNRRNLEAVTALARDLEDAGHHVWFDQAVAGGHRWWESILAQVRGCDLFVFTLTPDSLESLACRQELDYAVRLHKTILPILLSENVPVGLLPRPLDEIQFVDYRRPDRRTAFALTRAITSLPAPQPLPDPLPEPPPVPASYLNTLRERIERIETLDAREQKALVFEIKKHLRDDRAPDEAQALCLRLKQREDLLAMVAEEIDAILAELPAVAGGAHPAPERGPQGGSVPAAAEAPDPTPDAEEAGDDPIAVYEVADEAPRILQRVLQHQERWSLEIDPKNSIVVRCDTSSTPPMITAQADFRDDVWGSKRKALKALGWKINDHGLTKGLAGGALLYATGGVGALALLNGTVRDYLMGCDAARSWPVTKSKRGLVTVAGDLQRALEGIAPGGTVTAKRQDDGPDEPGPS